MKGRQNETISLFPGLNQGTYSNIIQVKENIKSFIIYET